MQVHGSHTVNGFRITNVRSEKGALRGIVLVTVNVTQVQEHIVPPAPPVQTRVGAVPGHWPADGISCIATADSFDFLSVRQDDVVFQGIAQVERRAEKSRSRYVAGIGKREVDT